MQMRHLSYIRLSLGGGGQLKEMILRCMSLWLLKQKIKKKYSQLAHCPGVSMLHCIFSQDMERRIEFNTKLWPQNRAVCVRSQAPVFLLSMRFVCLQTLRSCSFQVFVAIFSWEWESVTPQLLRKYKVLSFPTVPACIREESRETLWMDEGSITGQTHTDTGITMD